MDCVAVSESPDSVLRDFGLALGDIYSLKAFCQTLLSKSTSNEREERKRKLVEELQKEKEARGNKSSSRLKKLQNESSTMQSETKSIDTKPKQVQLGWLHYSNKDKKLKGVRERNGGGSRKVFLSGCSTKSEVIQCAKNLFFPGGVSKEGREEDFCFDLANFAGDVIVSSVIDSNGKELPFTISNYAAAAQLPRIRLYLTSRPQEQHQDTSDDDLKPVSWLQQKYKQKGKKRGSVSTCTSTMTKNKDQAYQERRESDVKNVSTSKHANEESPVDRSETLQQIQQQQVLILPTENKKEQCQALDSYVEASFLGFGNYDTPCILYDTMTNYSCHEGKKQEATTSAFFPVIPEDGVPQNIMADNSSETQNDNSYRSTSEEKPDTKDQPAKKMAALDTSMPDGNGHVDSFDEEVYFKGQTPEQHKDSKEVQEETLRTNDPGRFFRQISLPILLNEQGITINDEEDNDDTYLQYMTHSSSQNQFSIGNSGEIYPGEIYIHRSCLKNDLIEVFKSAIPSQDASFRVIDNKGNVEKGEGAGVKRDVLTTFWNQVFSSLTVGDIEKVPVIRHDYQHKEWSAIGEILAYGAKNDFFPLGLSKAFITSCLYGEDLISQEYLLNSFRNYITSDEREVFDKVVNGPFTEVDTDDLLEFLGNYKCYKKPSKDNVAAILSELAHQELIQRPRYVAQCWAVPLKSLKYREEFKTPESIASLYEKIRPTPKKVVKSLVANPSNEAEKQAFDFLKKFIRSLDDKALQSFLKYTTGSCYMMEQGLSISFTHMDGFQRRPIAHTCGPSLDLPCTYQSYPELAEELTNILSDKDAWGFNIV